MADESDGLEKFLKDVEEVGSIIQNLSSQDEEEREKAMKASDQLLERKKSQLNSTEVNKVEINPNSHKENSEQCQEQLLRSIEADANERASRRKKNETKADTLKRNGNAAFKAGRYEEAIKCYTEAINLVKYIAVLYTNRAQAYINVGKYDAAVDDCKWAIRVDKKCIKAYVHCGRALQRKSCFSEVSPDYSCQYAFDNSEHMERDEDEIKNELNMRPKTDDISSKSVMN